MDKKIFEKALNKKKLNQADLARELNMTLQRITDMKMGRLHGWKYRRRLSLYLEVPEEILFPDSKW